MGYQLIETIEVGVGGAASIEFTGIPQDGVDLVILASAGVGTGGPIQMRLNGDSGSNYNYKNLRGNGGIASSTGTSQTEMEIGLGESSDANTVGSYSVYISNYTSSIAKSVSCDAVGEGNVASAYKVITAGNYTGTSPVTSALLKSWNVGYPFEEYSTFSLYKITAD
tara:strand:+ start:383 stop:883 length:501 start_codon:yes stop_codon:yes gene_type:complete